VATGGTVEETQREVRAAIRFHLDGLRADNLTIPEPSTRGEHIEASRLLCAQSDSPAIADGAPLFVVPVTRYL
jgi:hypothetical protein